MVKNKAYKTAEIIALVGIMAATLECAKLALASLPNIEAVTLLTAVYGYVFGPLGIAATLVFVAIEPLIWGFGTWFISYLIYWPLVATVFTLIRLLKIKNKILLVSIATVSAILLTAFFGVLTSLVDIGLFSGSYDRFFYRFSIYYMRGVSFYLTQIITNALVFPIIFLPLTSALGRLKSRML